MNVAKDVVKYVTRIALICLVVIMMPIDSDAEEDIYNLTNVEVEWEKEYGEKGWCDVTNVVKTHDNGFVFAGTKKANENETQSNLNFYIIKVNKDGKLIWEKDFGGEGDQIINSIANTIDGGFVVAGETQISGSENSSYIPITTCYVAKLNNKGDIVWSHNYNKMKGSIKCIKQMQDKNFIVAGWLYNKYHQAEYKNMDAFIMKIDEKGESIWKDIDEKGESMYNSLDITSDKGIVVTGYSIPLGYYKDCLVTKYDDKGKISWTKSFGGSKDDIGDCIIQNAAGEFIITGKTASTFPYRTHCLNIGNTDWMLAKLDSQGELKWIRLTGNHGVDESNSIVETDINTYLITGCIFPDMVLVEMDDHGDIIYEKKFEYESHSRGIGLVYDTNQIMLTGITGQDIIYLKLKWADRMRIIDSHHNEDSLYKEAWEYSNVIINTQKDISPSIISKHVKQCKDLSGQPIILGTKDGGNLAVEMRNDGNNINGYILSYTKYDKNINNKWSGSINIKTRADLVDMHEHNGNYNIYYKSRNENHTENIHLLKLATNGNVLVNKILYDNLEDYHDIVETNNDDYVIMGSHIVNNQSDLTLVKINKNNKFVWKKELHSNSDEYFYRIIEVSDGKYIAIGTTTSTDGIYKDNKAIANGCIISINTDGSIDWVRVIDNEFGSTLHDIEKIDDEHLLVVGGISENQSMFFKDYLVVKINIDGTFKWMKTYGGKDRDCASAVTTCSDGDYLIGGYTYSIENGVHGKIDYWILKLDTDGNLKWDKAIGGENYEHCMSIVEINSKQYGIFGIQYVNHRDYPSHKFYMVTILDDTDIIDNSPYIEWQRSIGGEGSDYCDKLYKTMDGGYLIIGNSRSKDINLSNKYEQPWIVKFTSEWKMDWHIPFDQVSPYTDFSDIEETEDGGFVLAGIKVISTKPFKIEDYYIKISRKGIIEWEKTTDKESQCISSEIEKTQDNNFFFISKSFDMKKKVLNNFNSSYKFSKYSSNGEVISEFDYNPKEAEELTGMIKALDDGHFMFVNKKVDNRTECWIQRIDKDGGEVFKKKYDTNENEITTLAINDDNNMIVLNSSNNAVNGSTNIKIITLDNNGLILKNIKTELDNIVVKNAINTVDDGIVVIGYRYSNDDDADIVLFKVDADGIKQWEKIIGGSGEDTPIEIQQTENEGYILLGNSSSDDGDVTSNHGGYDYWIVKLSPEGNIQK